MISLLLIFLFFYFKLVIALLDRGIMEQLIYSSRHRKRKVAEAVAGKNAPKPTHASLESCSTSSGNWLFRVVNEDGVALYTKPSTLSDDGGFREKGEYVRCIGLSADGEWVQLAVDEDLDAVDQNNHQFYNRMYSKRQLWISLRETNEKGLIVTCLEEVTPEDSAVIDIQNLDEILSSSTTHTTVTTTSSSSTTTAAASTGTGDLFDKPFIPRVDEGGEDSSNENSAGAMVTVDIDIEKSTLEKVVTSVNTASALQQQIAPLGSSVVVVGLKARNASQYNNVTGVVVTPCDTATGRQGVRLDAPFSGKILSLKSNNFAYCDDDDDDETAAADVTAAMASGEVPEEVKRGLRLLGLKLSQLQLSSTTTSNSSVDNENNANTGCWGFVGFTTGQKINTALRASLRDLRNDNEATTLVYQAADVLRRHFNSNNEEKLINATDVHVSRSPVTLLRSGALGTGTAASVVSAYSTTSVEEQIAGIEALQEILQDAVHCYQDPKLFQQQRTNKSLHDDGSGDILLLRLALVQALLDVRREQEALDEAIRTQAFVCSLTNIPNKKCPACEFLLARCQLRRGQRNPGIMSLKEAVGTSSSSSAADSLGWLESLWSWGQTEANRFLEVHVAVERCRGTAVEIYSRGSFQDAANLYGRALALLQAGLSDDKLGKAITYADRSGCLRRDRKLDEAIADLDASLRLFPRFTRAIFRRAACLLELGKATESIEGFKDLYRIDRNWSMLSEWLVRAYALQKRQSKGYTHTTEKGGFSGNQTSGSPYASQKTEETYGGEDAERVALAVDHYAVLGVTTDATDKQLKTAYRMRSLQYHPDRKSGSTAAFQRIAEAYHILSDADKRRDYDEGKEIKVKRGRMNEDDDDDDDEEEDEEHKTTLREEVEREYYPERYQFWPFGDPFIYKRKREAQKRAKEGKPSWFEEGF